MPVANPIGLGQRVLQSVEGRFDLASGENFNRHYADLYDAVVARVDGALTFDATHNVALIRDALREAAAALPARNALESLRRTLLGLSIDADIVLDLHCDSQAVLHLYTETSVLGAGGAAGALPGLRRRCCWPRPRATTRSTRPAPRSGRAWPRASAAEHADPQRLRRGHRGTARRGRRVACLGRAPTRDALIHYLCLARRDLRTRPGELPPARVRGHAAGGLDSR